MAKDFAKPFYDGKKWNKLRKKYIEDRQAIDGGLCETCHEAVGVIVHHNDIWIDENNIDNPDVTLNYDNLKLDCIACHNREKKDEQERERYRFGPDGEVLPP